MRKSLLTIGAASLALSSFASTRILYQQNFETATSVEETGWSYGGASIAIASDAFGKYLELQQGQNNGRSGQVTWGQEIFLDAEGNTVLEDGTYKVEYDFALIKGSNNQYNGCFTVFTNHTPVANQPYRNPWSPAGYWQNYLFDMSQVDGEALQYAIDGGTTETTGEDGTISYAIDYSQPSTFDEGAWYTVTLDVNVNNRTVEYSVVTLDGNILKAGTRTVPEADVNGDPISMYAEGLFVMVARYATIIDFDNIKVSYESEKEIANPPTVALTRLGQTADEELDLNMRAYTITFLEDETLHITGTDGKEIEADYADCDGAYVYETTTSGTMKAWTTNGSATSEVIETVVDCAPVALPGVTATISSVSAGYGKTYTLSVSNEDVPLRPTIFIDYEFTGVNGEKVSASGEASGVTVTVSEQGTLKITSAAYGYQSTTVSVENDLEFETKAEWDFARMTDEEIKAAGFPDYQVLNSATTSGFNNWTARKRLYYLQEGSEHENEEGAIVWEAVYPFGFISEENTVNVMYYTELDTEGEVATNVAGYELFPGLNVFAGHNVSYLKHVGVYNNATTGGNNKNIDVLNLDATDFVVMNTISDYGSNSNHPICSTDEAYYAQLAGANTVFKASDGTLNEETNLYTVSCPVYRIDTACTKLTVFKQAGVEDAVETINAVNGDGYWYSIDGIRVAEPTRPGLYIHNGKKIIVK